MSNLVQACQATGIYFSDGEWMLKVVEIFAVGVCMGYWWGIVRKEKEQDGH